MEGVTNCLPICVHLATHTLDFYSKTAKNESQFAFTLL